MILILPIRRSLPKSALSALIPFSVLPGPAQQKVDVDKLVNGSFAQEAVPPGVENRTLRQLAFVLRYMHQSINESNTFCESPLSGS